MPRILNIAFTVTLRADDDISIILDHSLEKRRRLTRMNIKIPIEKHYEIAL